MVSLYELCCITLQNNKKFNDWCNIIALYDFPGFIEATHPLEVISIRYTYMTLCDHIPELHKESHSIVKDCYCIYHELVEKFIEKFKPMFNQQLMKEYSLMNNETIELYKNLIYKLLLKKYQNLLTEFINNYNSLLEQIKND